MSQERGTNITVLMPYVDRLEAFAFWYRQITADSLGKQGPPAIEDGKVLTRQYLSQRRKS